MKPDSLPLPLDPRFYRETYADLRAMSDAELLNHFETHGIREGRTGSAPALRPEFIKLLDGVDSVLEIGPFHSPAIKGPHVKYMDLYDKEELQRLARKLNEDDPNLRLNPDNCPEIDYVSADLSVVRETFSVVFSSHNVEHHPDLVAHLRDVERVLKDGGRYFIICPDKRYCFDHYQPETAFADVFAAHLSKPKRHSDKTLLSCHLFGTHNDSGRHWEGGHGPRPKIEPQRVEEVLLNYLNREEYLDAHAWRFTPQSFFEILSTLYGGGRIGLYPERVYHTVRGSNEFTAVLRKGRRDASLEFVAPRPPEPKKHNEAHRRAPSLLLALKRKFHALR